MRCQDVKRLITGSSEREPSAEDRFAVEEHIRQCSKCAEFFSDWRDLLGSLKAISGPRVPPGLEERVRARCREELTSLPARHSGAEFGISVKIPWFLYAVLGILGFLTVIILAPGAEALFRTYEITSETAPAFVLMLQNGLMLFFVPVILGRLNGRRVRGASR